MKNINTDEAIKAKYEQIPKSQATEVDQWIIEAMFPQLRTLPPQDIDTLEQYVEHVKDFRISDAGQDALSKAMKEEQVVPGEERAAYAAGGVLVGGLSGFLMGGNIGAAVGGVSGGVLANALLELLYSKTASQKDIDEFKSQLDTDEMQSVKSKINDLTQKIVELDRYRSLFFAKSSEFRDKFTRTREYADTKSTLERSIEKNGFNNDLANYLIQTYELKLESLSPKDKKKALLDAAQNLIIERYFALQLKQIFHDTLTDFYDTLRENIEKKAQKSGFELAILNFFTKEDTKKAFPEQMLKIVSEKAIEYFKGKIEETEDRYPGYFAKHPKLAASAGGLIGGLATLAIIATISTGGGALFFGLLGAAVSAAIVYTRATRKEKVLKHNPTDIAGLEKSIKGIEAMNRGLTEVIEHAPKILESEDKELQEFLKIAEKQEIDQQEEIKQSKQLAHVGIPKKQENLFDTFENFIGSIKDRIEELAKDFSADPTVKSLQSFLGFDSSKKILLGSGDYWTEFAAKFPYSEKNASNLYKITKMLDYVATQQTQSIISSLRKGTEVWRDYINDTTGAIPDYKNDPDYIRKYHIIARRRQIIEIASAIGFENLPDGFKDFYTKKLGGSIDELREISSFKKESSKMPSLKMPSLLEVRKKPSTAEDIAQHLEMQYKIFTGRQGLMQPSAPVIGTDLPHQEELGMTNFGVKKITDENVWDCLKSSYEFMALLPGPEQTMYKTLLLEKLALLNKDPNTGAAIKAGILTFAKDFLGLEPPDAQLRAIVARSYPYKKATEGNAARAVQATIAIGIAAPTAEKLVRLELTDYKHKEKNKFIFGVDETSKFNQKNCETLRNFIQDTREAINFLNNNKVTNNLKVVNCYLNIALDSIAEEISKIEKYEGLHEVLLEDLPDEKSNLSAIKKELDSFRNEILQSQYKEFAEELRKVKESERKTLVTDKYNSYINSIVYKQTEELRNTFQITDRLIQDPTYENEALMDGNVQKLLKEIIAEQVEAKTQEYIDRIAQQAAYLKMTKIFPSSDTPLQGRDESSVKADLSTIDKSIRGFKDVNVQTRLNGTIDTNFKHAMQLYSTWLESALLNELSKVETHNLKAFLENQVNKDHEAVKLLKEYKIVLKSMGREDNPIMEKIEVISTAQKKYQDVVAQSRSIKEQYFKQLGESLAQEKAQDNDVLAQLHSKWKEVVDKGKEILGDKPPKNNQSATIEKQEQADALILEFETAIKSKTRELVTNHLDPKNSSQIEDELEDDEIEENPQEKLLDQINAFVEVQLQDLIHNIKTDKRFQEEHGETSFKALIERLQEKLTAKPREELNVPMFNKVR